jgi:hypothetical protein
MGTERALGWKSLMAGYPWFAGKDRYPLPAYSEFMPSPQAGRKPLGEIDPSVLSEDDPYGWKISELEEEYELKPGIVHAGQQIMHGLIKLGRGETEYHIHGHAGRNLQNNPYWPPELAAHAGKLPHERFLALIPMMLSRTQDDKGRVTWSFFGNTIHDPEAAFWKGLYHSPGKEVQGERISSFFEALLSSAYGEDFSGNRTLFKAGLRILPAGKHSLLPRWAEEFLVSDSSLGSGARYLLTFRPFSRLPQEAKDLYLNGHLCLLPFPGSLVFWGMETYQKLAKRLPAAGQIPLGNLVARNRGLGVMRVAQSGWFHEPRRDSLELNISEELVDNFYQRTHRWEKILRYQDELNQAAQKVRIAKALFGTDGDSLGLYDKPLARNCQIWDHKFDLVLDGPKADRNKIYEAEKVILDGGLFGYRFFYPPMRTGIHAIYWHRPLVAWLRAGSEEIEFSTEFPEGYIACYRDDDQTMEAPLELWPRIQKREIYLSALRDFTNGPEHYWHQASLNILSLLEGYRVQGGKALPRSLAHRLLSLSKHETLEEFLDGLTIHTSDPKAASRMRSFLEGIIEPDDPRSFPSPLTFQHTATRKFEEAWWNDIRHLAHGDFIYKDNADIATDQTTRSVVERGKRDIEDLGDYLINRHRQAIAEAGMDGVALCGELPFKWQTDFEYSLFGGWLGNEQKINHERNILVVIPGRDRREAVVLADHYDTAYMEDIYEKGHGGSGARLASKGADDNGSASATLLQAAPLFLKMAKEGRLERDIWLIHLTGEEFPADCMGARDLCRKLVEKDLGLKGSDGRIVDLLGTRIVGVYVMDMIGHNRDNDRGIFQISPGKSAASLDLAKTAHQVNLAWNSLALEWNRSPERIHLGSGKRIPGTTGIPDPAKHLVILGEVRTEYNPHSSLFNTDGQIFSDTGVPVVLFMENYDINRSGYHDTHDTMENIDLDYGAALAAIIIETVAEVASVR